MADDRIKKPAAFIDRDGTLIEEVNFLSSVDDLQLFPFTEEAVKMLRDAGFHIIVVTNQSGIGRGIYTEDDMHAIHEDLQRQLNSSIDSFHFCPHLPDDGCKCRKPNLGMIEAAREMFEIEMDGSWMIGDKDLDIETGFNAGIGTALVRTGYGKEHDVTSGRQPDIVAEDLLDAVRQIVES